MDKINILIVDDHPMMRDALRMSFADEDQFHVIAEAADGQEAMKVLETHLPDIILMDLLMPNMSGVDAIESIVKLYPQIKTLVLTSMED
jgi:DNA-binding NarL/FixJ family response regulator